MARKLIRDKIPDLAASDGDILMTKTMSDKEFVLALKQKLTEEAQEVMKAEGTHIAEELADCEEVIRAITAAHGISMEQVESVRLHKLNTNGGFEKRLLLVGKNGNHYD